MGKKWYLYLVRCADDSLYCGVSTDVERRLAMHNGDLPGGAKYTRGRRPVRLEYAAAMPDKGAALRAEILVKSCPRAEKLARLKMLEREAQAQPAQGNSF